MAAGLNRKNEDRLLHHWIFMRNGGRILRIKLHAVQPVIARRRT